MAKDVLTPGNLGGLKVQKVKEAHEGGLINLMIYGEPGHGKTTLAGSADEVPEMRPVLLLNIEGGSLPLKEKYPNIEEVRIHDFKELQAVYDALHRQLHANVCPWNTIILDNITEAQKYSMASIMKAAVEKNPEREGGEDVAGMREWGINLEQMRRLIRAFRDLPINTIYVAHSKQDQLPNGKTITKPSLTGKMGNEVAGFLDVVLFLYLKELEDKKIHRLLLTGATSTTIAKDRSGHLPQVLTDPSMKSIYHTILYGTQSNETPTEKENENVNAS